MADWAFLNKHRHRLLTNSPLDQYVSDDSFGFNGLFRFLLDGRFIRCICSDGMGWQHVSVSIEGDKRCPTWEIMCKIKDLFWEPEDWVCQFHPAHSEYVNNHQGCLHLWRPTGQNLPTPDAIMVGVKGKRLV